LPFQICNYPPRPLADFCFHIYTVNVFANILLDTADSALDVLFTYIIPAELAGAVQPGSRVYIPLQSRKVRGFVMDVMDYTDVPIDKLKPIISVSPAPPAFNLIQAKLALWIAQRCLCSIADALKPSLADSGVLTGQKHWNAVSDGEINILFDDSFIQQTYSYIVQHPGISTSAIKDKFGDNGEMALLVLLSHGKVRPSNTVTKIKPRVISVVKVAISADEMREIAAELPKKQAKQAAFLIWSAENLLTEFSGIAETAKRAGVGSAIVKTAIEKGWVKLEEIELRRNPWSSITGRGQVAPVLSQTQQIALNEINTAIDGAIPKSFLLYGVTGSGKTEVFLHGISHALEQGKSTIILVPEISLTAQAMALYHGRFPGQVAVLHSNLGVGERYDEWQRISKGEAKVIVGARSAIFAPVVNLGLIIIDEEHESSYKQDSSPRYHAKDVAIQLGHLTGAPVVLASATPSLESMYEAEKGKHQLLRLPERIADRPMPEVKIVDLRTMAKTSKVISVPLREEIEKRLANKEQIILFLNRRGFAHTLLCRDCGRQESCPYCAVPLTYHKMSGIMRCHHCDHTIPAISTCPDCKGVRIAFRGVGTEQLEAEVQAIWPTARIDRLDKDTTSRKGSHHEILEKFRKEETDILIGTQMVAKGFDFPRVTLVGVIMADTSLGVADFRAPERTFQLLTQVAGRAGRSEWKGEVVVQTYQPEHYAVIFAAQHDYDRFYEHEIVQRKSTDGNWPPQTSLINIVVTGENESHVIATVNAIAKKAKDAGARAHKLPKMEEEIILPGFAKLLFNHIPEKEDEIEEQEDAGYQELIVNDPAPCPLQKLRNRYRYHVILRGSDQEKLLAVAKKAMTIKSPREVSMSVDVDPLSLV
jgi:primosomal protein N' (replication factor Y)